MKNNQEKQSKGLSIFFSIILLIIILIIIAVQITVLYYYGSTANKGRCVYGTDSSGCECTYTNIGSCNSMGGVFQPNLRCEDGIGAICDNIIKSRQEI